MPTKSKKAPIASPTKKVSNPKAPASGDIKGNTSRDHIHRIYVILSALQNSQYVSKTWLADQCGGVSIKTIERDISAMEALMDVDIPYDKTNRGYRIVGDVKHFPMVKLESRDMLMLHFLRQCLQPYVGTDIGMGMIDSFNRTFGLIAGTQDWKKWEDAIHFQFEGKPEIATGDVDLFNLLHEAIRDHEKVSFDYQPAGGRGEDHRIVEPHFLFMRNGRWYLYASKDGKPDKRTLAFARIRNAKKTGANFTQKKINPKDCFRYSFGVVIGEHPPRENVVLDFSPDVAQRISETLWHPEQKTTKLPNGGLRLSLPFAESTYLEIKPWLLSWEAKVSVVAPESLKKDIEEIIRTMARANGIL